MNESYLNWVSTSGRLLGALFYHAPDQASLQPILQFLSQADWQQQWHNFPAQQNLEQQIQQGLQSQQLDSEYQALFIGPNSLIAPPWGSVYLDPESVLFGCSLIELREFLQQHQVAFALTSNEPEDHFGLMLLLAAYLAENHAALLKPFLAQHLLTWSERYLSLLIAQQDSLFYQAVARLAQHTLADWQQQLDIQVNAVRLYR